MIYVGNSVSEGIVIGRTYCYQQYVPYIAERTIQAEGAEAELKRFYEIKALAANEINGIREALLIRAPEKAKIFDAHLEILDDEEIEADICDNIREGLLALDWAIETVFGQFIRTLSKARDALIRERVSDLRDVKNRLIRIYSGEPERNLSLLTDPVIVVAHDLLPSDTATIDRENVLGIITEIGGSTSHTAIIAKSYGIPAVLGVKDALLNLHDHSLIIEDANDGKIISSPTEEDIKLYTKKLEEHQQIQRESKQYLKRAGMTKDCTHIMIGMNIGAMTDEEIRAIPYVDNIGLFRTEFLYMNSDHLPTEEEQFEAYKKVLMLCADRPVTLRTLDIGGDKTLPYFQLPKEDNPFLGKRALRLCLSHPDIFRTQLRAALRASVYGNLQIMFPMVSSVDDIFNAMEAVNLAKSELRADGGSFRDDIKFGIMIEIPAIAMIADIAAQHIDFASIGTNDLCQYMTATDRLNPGISSYYQSLHPAMLLIMSQIIHAFNLQGKPISVCGELAGNPHAAPLLVGLGIRKLSMSVSCIAKTKQILSAFTVSELEAIAQKTLTMSSNAEIETFLKESLQ